MTDRTETTVSAFIIRDFKDDGTQQRFTQGETKRIPEGQFINYEAAGLVRKPTAEDRSTTETKPAKPDGKAAG